MNSLLFLVLLGLIKGGWCTPVTGLGNHKHRIDGDLIPIWEISVDHLIAPIKSDDVFPVITYGVKGLPALAPEFGTWALDVAPNGRDGKRGFGVYFKPIKFPESNHLLPESYETTMISHELGINARQYASGPMTSIGWFGTNFRKSPISPTIETDPGRIVAKITAKLFARKHLVDSLLSKLMPRPVLTLSQSLWDDENSQPSSQLSDVKLIADHGKTQIPVHSFALKLSCRVANDLLSETPVDTLDLRNYFAETVKQLLTIIYHGSASISFEDSVKVYELANYLDCSNVLTYVGSLITNYSRSSLKTAIEALGLMENMKHFEAAVELQNVIADIVTHARTKVEDTRVPQKPTSLFSLFSGKPK